MIIKLVQTAMVLCRENRENAARAVGETVQFFITTMDSLKLNMVAVDQLYPLLNDLMQSLNKVQLLHFTLSMTNVA